MPIKCPYKTSCSALFVGEFHSELSSMSKKKNFTPQSFKSCFQTSADEKIRSLSESEVLLETWNSKKIFTKQLPTPCLGTDVQMFYMKSDDESVFLKQSAPIWDNRQEVLYPSAGDVKVNVSKHEELSINVTLMTSLQRANQASTLAWGTRMKGFVICFFLGVFCSILVSLCVCNTPLSVPMVTACLSVCSYGNNQSACFYGTSLSVSLYPGYLYALAPRFWACCVRCPLQCRKSLRPGQVTAMTQSEPNKV